MDFRMETFITVCETMNFTRAAEKMNITQPAVSQHIHYLEDEYQVKLFSFSGRKMKLTDSGSMMLNACITMKHDEMHLKDQLLANLDGGKRIAFGATLTVGEFIIPEQVASYLKTNKNTKLKMLIANTSELLAKLDSGVIDFAIVEGYFTKNEYEHRIYSKEKYIAVSSALHQFKNNIKSLEDIFDENLIVREEGSGTREILERTLEGKNYALRDFKNIVEISNMNTIKFLTQEDCGITFLYEAAVKKELEQGALKKIDLDDMNITHDITFIWRKNSMFSDYYVELFESLRK